MDNDPNFSKFKLVILTRLLLVPIGIFLAIILFTQIESCRNKTNAPATNSSPAQRESQKTSTEPGKTTTKFEDIIFPKNFFFGTAYSDFQTAGLAPASD